MDDVKKEVEAILFASGRTVPLEELELLLTVKTPGLVKEAIAELKREYSERDSPVMIIDEGEGWKLTVKEKYLKVVHRINPHTELSKAVMETLAIIAWKQPLLQSEVIKIRTNKAYDHIKELSTLGFISKEREGRSYILKPTNKFMEYFDLPDQEAVKEMFKEFKDVEIPKPKGTEDENGEATSSEGTPDEPEKLGNLEVFDENEVYTPALKSEKGGAGVEEKLGDLPVYSEGEKEVAEAAQEEQASAEVEEESQEVLSEEDKERVKAKELAESLLGEEKKEGDEGGEPEQEESKLDPALENFEKRIEAKDEAEDKKLEEEIAPSGKGDLGSASGEESFEEAEGESLGTEVPVEEKPVVEVGAEDSSAEEESDVEEVAPEDIPHTESAESEEASEEISENDTASEEKQQ